MKLPCLPVVRVPVVPVRQCMTTTLPCEMQAHICNWLCLRDMLQIRVLCKASFCLFEDHVDSHPAFWLNKLTSSKLVWAQDSLLRGILAARVRATRTPPSLTQFLCLFRPVFTLDIEHVEILFAAIKNSEDGTLLARTSVLMPGTQFDWNEDWLQLYMPLSLCVDGEKIFKRYEPKEGEEAFDYWAVPVSIQLYSWSGSGL